MIRFLIKQLLLLALVYAMASVALFVAIKAMPGDPVALKFGKHPDPEAIARERERLGLDRSLGHQFVAFNLQFVSGNWGESLLTGRSAGEDVRRFFPATLELSLAALGLGVLAGLGVALYARTGSSLWGQRLALGLGGLGLTVPVFWIGLLALALGSLALGWFPGGGRSDLAAFSPPVVTGMLILDTILAGDFAGFRGALHYLALPALCLALYPAANVASALYARLGEPDVTAMRLALQSRGYSPLRIALRHLARTAGAPVATVIGTTFGALLGGAFLTETVFSWPGIGRYLVAAILERDVFVAGHTLLLLIVLVFAVAFVSDAIARGLDPKAAERKGGE